MPQAFLIVDWRDNAVVLLDQRQLPAMETYCTLTDWRDVAEAIRNMTVRGAPAIGVAGAMGLALAAVESRARGTDAMLIELHDAARIFRATRPTAVNLAWGLERMLRRARAESASGPDGIKRILVAEAIAIKEEDIRNNIAMGRHGEKLLNDGDTVLTHCNAGALATAGFGTALGVIYAACAAGKKISVIVGETRPVLQGARLTTWELQKSGIPVTLICDNMAATLMQKKLIHKVIVGADRIAANGDAANKIGTYGLAVLAKHHGIPFYVVAPLSTIDPATPNGASIPIEERAPDEVTTINGKSIAPAGIAVRNPAFDVTPAELVTVIVTERGIMTKPFGEAIHDAYVPGAHL